MVAGAVVQAVKNENSSINAAATRLLAKALWNMQPSCLSREQMVF